MTILSNFYGITIGASYRCGHKRRRLPHIHAIYDNFAASVALDGTVIDGQLPPIAIELVFLWMNEHQNELKLVWNKSGSIEPLL